MTLKEATANGVDYWEFFVLVNSKQIHVAGKMVKRCWYFDRNDTVGIGNLSAPAGLEAVKQGNGWVQFHLDAGRLTVWPTEVSNGL